MLQTLLRLIQNASKHKNIFMQFIDVFWHKININTSPIDYYRFGFYDDSIKWDQKRRYVGKRNSYFYPWQSNQVQYSSLFDNKYIFGTMLTGFGLPHPNIIATIGRSYQIKTFDQFSNFMDHNLNDIVLKPLDGSGGRGIFVIYYQDKIPYILNEKLSLPYLWDGIKNGDKPYLIEQRIEQHSKLSSLFPDSLNTLRIITIKAMDNKWYFLKSFLRIGQKGNIDNIGAGGISVYLDSAGRGYLARDWSSNQNIENHPITNAPLVGITVPHYDEAIKLALDASEKFSFMGTIGWDIGISTTGPTIIEGNIFYDCYTCQFANHKPLIPEHLVSKLPIRKFWHRWDKTAMYPNANRWKIRS